MSAARKGRGVTRRRMLATGGAAVGVAFLAACGGGDDGSLPAGQSPAASDTAAARGAATAASFPSEFVVANEAEPSDLGPYIGGYSTWLVTAQVYETLAEPRLTINQQGFVDVGFTPHLAEGWERPEPLRWRMKLRPGVTFHNGEPWNAAAAKSSFDALADAKQASALSKTSYLARTMDGCEVIDDMTVDFITKQPDEETLRATLRIGFVGLPPKLLQEKGLQSLFENPVGTGPYAFKGWTRGQEIRLEKFAGHWNRNGPNMPAVRYIVRKEAAVRAQTVKSGEAHFAYNIGAEQAQGIKNTVVGGGFQSSGIRLNNTHPVTGDLRVRQALNMAIDRNAIVKSIFRGAATPLAFFGFQPVKLEPFPYRPEEAKKLIDAAGVRGTQLELVYGEGRIPEEDQLAEIYKAAFDAIGLRVQLKKLEPRQYNELGGKPFAEQPPLYMETTSSGNFGEIAAGLRDKYGCKGTGTFCKPEYDAEFDALAALSGEERNRKLQSIAERLHTEETPRVWVAAVQQVHGFADFVKPNLPANAYILFQDIRFG
jgi:peptide/nickel transport system substrate-binding protein